MKVPQRWRACQGATLLEVMIAVLIIGVGLLGIASLQVAALQGANNAQFRSRATDLAASLADRMRANLAADNDYRFDAEFDCDTDAPPTNVCAMLPSATDQAGIVECTPKQMAVYDVWEIQCTNGVRSALPGGTLVVACTDSDADDTDDCSDNSVFQISVTWQAQKRLGGSDNVVLSIIPGAQR